MIFFFFNGTATTETYTITYPLSLPDAPPIYKGHPPKPATRHALCRKHYHKRRAAMQQAPPRTHGPHMPWAILKENHTKA